MKNRINYFLFFSFILTCCSVSSNEYQTEKQEFEELEFKNLSISSTNLSNNMEIIYYESKDTLKDEFLSSEYFFAKYSKLTPLFSKSKIFVILSKAFGLFL